MGLFDQFSNLSPDQNQGLLAAAAQMLQTSGPSLMPHSFGQVLGAGYQGYQQGMQGVQDRQLGALKMKALQSDLDQRQAQLDMQNRIRQRSLTDISGQPPTAQAVAPGMPAAPPDPSVSQPMASAMPGGSMSPKTGGPDWLQSYQASAPAMPTPTAMPDAAPSQAASPAQAQPTSLTQSVMARLTRQAQIHAEEGDMDGANKLYEQATKFMPEVNKIEVGQDPTTGKPINVITYKDGRQEVSQFAPKPDIHWGDDGQHTAIPFNGYTGQAMGTGVARQATPGEILQNRQTAARLAFDQSQANSNQDDAMDPLAVHMTAQQYLAGDTSALQNFGRGAQGAKNLNAVRAEVARLATAQGLNGADIAAKVAEFAGTKAGQRTAATRSAGIEIAANEVSQLAPLALDASSKVARSGFKPFGNAQIMFDSHTNDPNMRQFAMANTALVNAYGQAMARGGSATVSDKDHARELLSTTFDQPSYAAAVSQLQQEIKAAQAAPKAVRKELSNAVSGRESDASPSPSPTQKSVLKGQIVRGYRFKGGDPSVQSNWEKA